MKLSTKLLCFALALMPIGLVIMLKYRAESHYTFIDIGRPIANPTRVIELLPDSIAMHQVPALSARGISVQSLPVSHPAVPIFRKSFAPLGSPSPEADWTLVIGVASVFGIMVIISIYAVSANHRGSEDTGT